jgi:hypothetical protein
LYTTSNEEGKEYHQRVHWHDKAFTIRSSTLSLFADSVQDKREGLLRDIHSRDLSFDRNPEQAGTLKDNDKTFSAQTKYYIPILWLCPGNEQKGYSSLLKYGTELIDYAI